MSTRIFRPRRLSSMQTLEQERAAVLERISLAFVNGYITQQAAAEARAALLEQWEAGV